MRKRPVTGTIAKRHSPASSEKAMIALARRCATTAIREVSRTRVAGVAVSDEDDRVWSAATVVSAVPSLSASGELIALYSAITNGAQRIGTIAIFTDTVSHSIPSLEACDAIARYAPNATVLLCSRGRVVRRRGLDLLPSSDRAHGRTTGLR